MFRNPRENINKPPSQRVRPSVGRAPSPPAVSTQTIQPQSAPLPPKPMATKTMPARPSRTSSTPKAKQTKLDFSKSTGKSSAPKQKVKPNASILSFFKKTDGPPGSDPGLFFEDRGKGRPAASIIRDDDDDEEASAGSEDDQALGGELMTEESRFNENEGSVKRQRTSDTQEESSRRLAACTPPPPDFAEQKAPEEKYKPSTLKRPSGPFLDDSDSEDETAVLRKAPSPPKGSAQGEIKPSLSNINENSVETIKEVGQDPEPVMPKDPPPLNHEPTSYADENGFADFEGIEDFDEFDEGEEFDERLWMQEQIRLEMVESGFKGDPDEFDPDTGSWVKFQADAAESSTILVTDAPICPICSTSLEGLSDQDASIHVNNCLDGNPTPLSKVEDSKTIETPVKVDGSKRFIRPPRPPKPGQENPFIIGESSSTNGSAFSRLMSSHAEDAAWASAAAAENAARGKPSYQRTCPFYKILPGFFICVDAFRYGAVQGCKAYFLSHFHSDHYVGLSASWNHGPIYCSKVTANLVRQQLRVDPKWVIDLEWEKETEVPGTDGVKVTMISANHCPGSSLYLFEKAVNKGKNPKVQRVMHCGDFRACRAHVEHPLLRPEVMNAVTGKSRQQKIDVCYLDTTYLNPKYAFPSQEDVIKACADMCISLNKIRVDEADGWERMKRERAGEGMVKFVRKDSDIKQEPLDSEDSDAIDVTQTTESPTGRGRLLVVVGTYSIGKERICLGIAKALDSKIYAPPNKQRVCAALEDPELNARLTTDPREAQVHMTPLFEIRADTLDDYLKDFRDTFSRAVGFRPSGWNYRPPNSRFTESPQVQTVLHSQNWKSGYSMRELVPQRGSTHRASCFGVPYSEHSSFRELTMFCCALKIDKIIPTVNVGNAKSRERMKGWCEKWAMEKKKNGLFKLKEGESW